MEPVVCIRPCYAWPATAPRRAEAARALPACADEGCSALGAGGRSMAGLFSGCGVHGATLAAAAAAELAAASGDVARWLQDERLGLEPSALEAAFERCHEQLLRPRPDQGQEQQRAPGADASRSGASALLALLDRQQAQLLVASAGLCKAVLARSSPSGELTVLELTPRLALGHDPAETARLDAAGSSIRCCQGAGGVAEAAAQQQQQQGQQGQAAEDAAAGAALPPAAVLVAPDGEPLHGLGASRVLGFGAAASAGVLPTPAVTSWRLNGSESFVVLGSPGLWQAMNPAEVADYVAAALSSGACGGDADGGDGAAATGTVGDLLSLEAQERLKLRLMDRLFGLCPGPECGRASGAGVVPDVAAVVLRLGGSRPQLRGAAARVDGPRLRVKAAAVSRACRSNAEARALQALWSASCFCCDEALAGPPAPALGGLLPMLSVGGHCWPSAFWPPDGGVRIPRAAPAAAAFGEDGSPGSAPGNLTLEEAAAGAGLLLVRRSSSKSIGSAGGGGACAAGRPLGFSLSPRLSCELELRHDHACGGSCGCLAGDCPAATAGALSGSPASEQSMILHKVRLSGPCELESLLFASATTSHPDTTVARILRPSGSGPLACGTLGRSASAAPLASQHKAPLRSASVSMGVLAASARRRSGSGSGAGSSGADGGALRLEAARSGGAGWSLSKEWGGAICSVTSGRLLSHDSSLDQLVQPVHQQQQQQQQEEQQQLGEAGLVKKARSYQALSALQAAGGRPSGPWAGAAPPPDARSLDAPRLGGAPRGASSAMAFRPAFRQVPSQPHGRAGGGAAARHQEPWPAGMASSAGVASGHAGDDGSSPPPLPVAMPLSCPAGCLAGEAGALFGAVRGEGKVRGGVARDRRSSLRLSADESARACEALALAGATGGDCEPEGKVRCGVALNRRSSESGTGSSLQELQEAGGRGAGVSAFALMAQQHAACDGASDGQVGGSVGSSAGGAFAAAAAAPGAAAVAAAASGDPSSGPGDQHGGSLPATASLASLAASVEALEQGSAQLPGRPEPCVRGGRVKAARMRPTHSSPDLPSLGSPCATAGSPAGRAPPGYPSRPMRVSWDGRCPAPAAASGIPAPGGRRLGHNSHGHRGARPAAQGKHGGRGGGDSLAASRSAGELLGQYRLSASSVGGSSSNGDSSADSSFTCSSSQQQQQQVLLGVLPSSAEEPPPQPAARAAPRPGKAEPAGAEERAPPSGAGLGPDSRHPSGCWSDSSAAGAADGAVHGGELGSEALEGQVHGGRRSSSMSLSGSMLLPSLSFASSGEEGELTASCGSNAGGSPFQRAASLAAAAAAAEALHPSSTSGASGGGVADAAAAGQPAAPAADSIQVLRMPSGSFTRVRLAASAPALAAFEGGSLAGGAVDDWAGAAAAAGGRQMQRFGSSSQLEAGRDQQQGQMRRVGSAGCQQAAFSAGGTGLQRGGSGPRADSWTSSRAWGSGAAVRKPEALQFCQVALSGDAGASAAAADRLGSGSGGGGPSGDQQAPQVLRVAFEAPPERQHPAAQAGEPAVAAVQLAAAGAKRQKSMPLPLPTLTESPTPGSSPEVAVGSYLATFEQQQQQQQPAGQQPLPPWAAGAQLRAQLEQMDRRHSQQQQCARPPSLQGDAADLAHSFEVGGSLSEFLLHEEAEGPGSPAWRGSSRSFEFSRHHPQDAAWYGAEGGSPGKPGHGAGTPVLR